MHTTTSHGCGMNWASRGRRDDCNKPVISKLYAEAWGQVLKYKKVIFPRPGLNFSKVPRYPSSPDFSKIRFDIWDARSARMWRVRSTGQTRRHRQISRCISASSAEARSPVHSISHAIRRIRSTMASSSCPIWTHLESRRRSDAKLPMRTGPSSRINRSRILSKSLTWISPPTIGVRWFLSFLAGSDLRSPFRGCLAWAGC